MSRPVVEGLGLETSVVRDASAFEALADDWSQLYAAAPRATPFQTHAWLLGWWRAYGATRPLRVFLVRSHGRLVAAAPLYVETRGPVRVLLPLGGAISDFVDIVVAESDGGVDTPALLSALVGALTSEGGWDVLDLPEVRVTAAAELLTRYWPSSVQRLSASTCMELPVTEFQELLLTLPTKRAREVRRVLRRSSELDLVVEDVAPADVADAVQKLLRLHALQWERRGGGNPEHQHPRFAQHLSEALTQMVQDHQAAVVRYQLEGKELAGQVVLIGHDFVGGYMLGVAPEVYDRMDFSTYVVRADMERAIRHQCSTYNMLRGQESYKERWLAAPARNSRLLLSRPGSPIGPAFALAVRALTRGKAVAKEKAPWLREVKKRYVQIRGRRPGR
jgi:CelD/BcsL family acetyltransferase involved in cellulose biosynthesis